MIDVIIGSSKSSGLKGEIVHKCITCGGNVYCIDNLKIQDVKYKCSDCAKNEGVLTRENIVVTDEAVEKINKIHGTDFTKNELIKMIRNEPDEEYFVGG